MEDFNLFRLLIASSFASLGGLVKTISGWDKQEKFNLRFMMTNVAISVFCGAFLSLSLENFPEVKGPIVYAFSMLAGLMGEKFTNILQKIFFKKIKDEYGVEESNNSPNSNLSRFTQRNLVVTSKAKLIYHIGEDLDLSGIFLELTDPITEDMKKITITKNMCFGFDSSSEDKRNIVEVVYDNMRYKYSVEITK